MPKPFYIKYIMNISLLLGMVFSILDISSADLRQALLSLVSDEACDLLFFDMDYFFIEVKNICLK